MLIKDMRDWCKKAYPGDNWAYKVDKMSDKQVQAIFIKLRKEGKINV
jgi:hypothetical protein|nr:MAG TPA: hypothetical protein [Caudoviricetes sp.]